jgi:hypothetical protein
MGLTLILSGVLLRENVPYVEINLAYKIFQTTLQHDKSGWQALMKELAHNLHSQYFVPFLYVMLLLLREDSDYCKVRLYMVLILDVCGWEWDKFGNRVLSTEFVCGDEFKENLCQAEH